MKYEDLPAVSIIIPFRDERLSVLLRTIHSILQNTPSKLLAEIIIIDDGSETEELKAKLDVHIETISKVHLIRLKPSAGLMVARQTGINQCKAEYLITMDCHIEVVKGWLEPLLHRLKQNPKACLSPNVGLIKRDTLGVDFSDRLKFTKFPMFAFNLEEAHSFYKTEFLSERNRSEPLPTGINQGMVIAMKKSWFEQLGGFDTGMKVWGGEQIELSVKVWTCGGIVEIIPCSYVAHLFKTRLVWKDMGISKIINAFRFAEVWMDGYKEMLDKYWPTVKRNYDLGPGLRERKVIRRQNRCKPFQYYIDKVKEFGMIHFPENLRNYGWIQNEGTDLCIEKDTMLEKCSKFQAVFQFYEHTEEYHIRHDGWCLFPASMINQPSLVLVRDECYALTPERSEWIYTVDKQLKHNYTNTCLCVKQGEHKPQLVLDKCRSDPNQRWIWKLWDS
ncbi:polypeptide N-acetylgalactosaminyltransferase 12-like [Ruditapes philippinarum]|uniref:polypeptide N-acetylgalactosaminyltransferase 12-like n=1 Tax=Ruditapes philippinarum TaxID=129788 RepID=UPI00295BC54D|nr:polypeptide N-acetylgalactosaminyltransferase 12-like [Ruditapes philippinarum]